MSNSLNIPQIGFSRKFLSDSFWSLFGNLVNLAASLISIKIITKLVTADAYGTASLVLGVVALLNNLLIGPLMVVHMRVYFDFLKDEMARWYSRVFNWILGIAGLCAILIYMLIAYAYNLRENYIFLQLIVPAAILIFAQPYIGALTSYLEAHRLYRRLALTNILQKILYPIILILLLFTALSGSYAIVLSQGLAIIPLIILLRVINEQKASDKRPLNGREELTKIKKSFASFGFALPLGYLAHWVLSTSDRYLIEHFMSLNDVGIYAINYGLWSVPYLMLNGWLEILTRPHIYDKAASNNWQEVKKILFWRMIVAVTASVIGTILLYILGESIASIMLGKHYWIGWQLMIYIAIAHCFMVIGYSVMPVFLANKKSRMIMLATSVAALSNIVINLVAIPAYGIIGAATSTLISYIIWAGILVTGAFFFIKKMSSHKNLCGGEA